MTSGRSSREMRRVSRPMPVIAEHTGDPPAIPARSPRRPPIAPTYGRDGLVNGSQSQLTVISSLSMSFGSPLYSLSAEEESVLDRNPDIFKEKKIRDRECVSQRGGWYRLIFASITLVAAVIGLAVGLSLGLTKESSNPSSAVPVPSDVFPAGAFTFTTALTSVSTGCTPNKPWRWRCHPDAIYDPDTPELSSASFDWIVTPVTTSSYVISSSDNPFAPTFHNVSMTLLDANQYTERFTFSFVMAMTVVPLPATNSNDKNNGNRKNGGAADAAICWFNETVVSATIWTRLPASYAGNVGMNATNSTYARDNNGFAPWPFAVQVEKTVVGKGDGILECKDAAGNTIASQYRERVRGEATTVSTTTR